MQKVRFRDWQLAIGFVLLNLLIKLVFINYRDLGMDEPFSIWWAQHSIPEIFNMLKTENNPALHFLFLHFWIKLFGISAFAVRLPSVIFSSFTAGLIYHAGTRFLTRKTGIAAAFIYTFSTLQLYFAHEARVYALFELLAVCNLYLCLAISRDPGKKRLFIWLFFCDLLLVYSHYFGWIVVGVQVLVLLLQPSRRSIRKPLLFSILALLLCYIPNFAILFNRFSTTQGGTWVHKPQFSELYGNINRYLNSRYVTLILLLTGVSGMVILFIKNKTREMISRLRNDNAFWMIFLWFFFPYLAMFAVSFIMPVFLDRYILFTTPGLYLLIAVLFDYLPVKKWQQAGFLIILLGAMLAFFNLNPDKNRRVAELVSSVKDLKEPGSLVLLSPEYSFHEFTYYYNKSAFIDYPNTLQKLKAENIYPVRSINELPTGIIDHTDCVIYVDCGAAFAFGEDIVGRELRNQFIQEDSLNVYEIYTIREFYRDK
jgi:mannosyltransferase